MAINRNDYTETKRNKGILTGIRTCKTDNSKFLLIFKNKLKVYHSFSGTPAEMIDEAIKAFDKFKGVKPKVSTSTTVDTLWDEYLLAREWSNVTMSKNVSSYKQFAQPVIGHLQLRNITSDHIDQMLVYLDGKSARTRNKVYELMNPFFKAYRRDDNPVLPEHKFKRNQMQEMKVILNPIQKYSVVKAAVLQIEDPKYRALFLFGLSGRRKFEASNILWEDVDVESRQYVIRAENSKVKQNMTFTMNEDLATAILEVKHVSQYLFASNVKPEVPIFNISTVVDDIRTATGYDEFSFHWMRNLLVSTLAAKGVEAIHLSSLLGHVDTNTIKRYLSLSRDKSSEIANNILNDL